MSSKILLRNIFRFIFLVLLQVLILNNIQFSKFINPYMYVLFILLMPFETPGWFVIMMSFFLGLSIDVFSFSTTLGMHTSATVFMGFLRSHVLNVISPRDGYEPGSFPRIYYYGFEWFFKYTVILVFAHHIFLFYMEVFRFASFFSTFFRVILSTLFSVFLIILSQYLVFRK